MQIMKLRSLTPNQNEKEREQKKKKFPTNPSPHHNDRDPWHEFGQRPMPVRTKIIRTNHLGILSL
jgi:hypothetical protein